MKHFISTGEQVEYDKSNNWIMIIDSIKYREISKSIISIHFPI